MLTIATLFWQANKNSKGFSSMYTEGWVEKLYRGFARNLTAPFRFVCYVDHERVLSSGIEQRLIASEKPDYGDCIQPYEMGVPMILVGLDTVVTGNCDHLAEYCLTADKIALPRDPFAPERACNGVALVPAGHESVWTSWDRNNKYPRDMEHMRAQPHVFLDDLFPDEVVSYKGHVKKHGLGDARIVYFHGREKPHEIEAGWIADHWH